MRKKILLIFFFIVSFLMFHVSFSYALELRSPRFKIDVGEINIDEQSDKKVFYTIESIFGSGSLIKLNTEGFVLLSDKSDQELLFSLNPALLTIPVSSNLSSAVTYSVISQNRQNFFLNLIQEYKLKNLNGDTIELSYATSKNRPFFAIPDQNAGDSPTLLTKGKMNQTESIFFRAENLPEIQTGTYTSILNFILIPDY